MALSRVLLAGIALLAACAHDAYAKPQNKPPAKPKNEVKFRIALAPSAELLDLASAKGRFDYDSKKKVVSLKGNVKLPVSTSLGILDATTAAASQIHAEWTREGQIVADCTLQYDPSEETSDDSQNFQFKLHIKNTGKRDVKGTCGASIPTLAKSDSVTVYKIISETERLTFMNQKQ